MGSIGEGSLTNCVIYGNSEYELAMDTLSLAGVSLNFQIFNCLIRSEMPFTEPFYSNILWNQNPLFEDVEQGDFLFSPNSPLHGNGIATGIFTDILGNPRQNPPDIGAVEL